MFGAHLVEETYVNILIRKRIGIFPEISTHKSMVFSHQQKSEKYANN
jgi:hypothetical protein